MNKKNIKLIGIAGIALLTVAGVGLIGLPIVTQTQTWAAEVEQSEASNQQLKTQLSGLENTKSQLANIQAINDELAIRFPNLPNGTDLLQNISSAASTAGIGAAGIESIAISAPSLIVDTAAADAAAAPAVEGEEGDEAAAAVPVAETPASNVASMDISLSIQATSDQILSFSREFNNMSRTIKIKTASISGGAEGASTFALTGVAYLYASILPPEVTEEAAPTEETPIEETPAENGNTTEEPEFEEF
jgi:Tfp pilus assembly protein PilO